MSVGYPQDKPTIDAKSGQYALALREALRNVQLFKAYLDSVPDAQLTAAGYVAADITLLRNAYTDLDKLRLISQAAATQPASSDFFFNAKQLIGPN
jgi:hypothetical protein